MMGNFMVEFFNTGYGCWQIMLDLATATSNHLDTSEVLTSGFSRFKASLEL
jgi:hypothetical protein